MAVRYHIACSVYSPYQPLLFFTSGRSLQSAVIEWMSFSVASGNSGVKNKYKRRDISFMTLHKTFNFETNFCVHGDNNIFLKNPDKMAMNQELIINT